MTARPDKLATAFLIDYAQRHKHPVNAALHIVGVPAVFYGVYLLFVRNYLLASVLIVFGYLLQYLGHRAQGNEVGEVTLIKKIAAKVQGK
ncbi:MAG: DUF962 domain-containing protein [Cyanobacteria bacterium TGS_CYA1]|nr:DUF962 domain-containing protein [Cyanobacteria bacterium TGS_CYA1]MDX2105288.1 Mpo1-like protein [Candidatus Melainabacteria bacterium]